MAHWFEVKARKGAIPEVHIYGDIGSGGVSAAKFSEEWRALGKPSIVNLRISSPGGDCFAGAAIHDIIANSGVNVTVYVDGLAASMASFIAMVGRKIIMGPSAQMMIHNPSAKGIGESHDMRRTADLLDSVKGRMARVYAKRSRQSEDTIVKWMNAETWFDAEAAVKAGFADEIAGDLKMAASAFDLSGFEHAPVTTPKTVAELAQAYWAGRKGTKSAPVAGTMGEDHSDLVPTPKSHAETWAKWNEMGRRNGMGGVK